CGNSLINEERCYCLHCNQRLPRTRFHEQAGNLAEQLFYGRCEVERVACFCYFEKGGSFREAIHRFKYHDSPRTAFNLGALYARELQSIGWQVPIDILLPVPLHWIKQLKRGYNQSEWIARGVGSVWQKPIRTDILIKRHHTPSQTRKSIYDRYLNASAGFKLKKKQNLEGKHILLIDDVLTSGSTLEACISALQQIPQVKISILTLGFAE
ncbi:MAG: ComF family protein, partial [Bacteroidales bacterium]